VNAQEALQALERLPLPETPVGAPDAGDPGADRFAWRFVLQGRGLQVDVLACGEGAGGWWAEERLPLRALPERGSAAWAGLGRRERTALEAFRRWSRDPAGFPLPLLAALEGHGRVMAAATPGDPGQPVVLLRELCALELREDGEGWRLALTRRPGEAPGVLRLEGDRLAFTPFGPLHRALDRLLGEGLHLKAEAAPRLARLLGRLLPHLPVLADRAPDPAPPAGGPSPGLLLWARGGGERLEARLRVRVAPRLPLFLPGEGPAWIAAGPPGARRLWHRDLLLERARAEQVRKALPACARPLEGALAWRMEGREAVLGFLAALRDLGPRVAVDGVPGLAPRVPERLEPGHLALELRKAQGRLVLEGSLKGHSLGVCLEGLRRSSRFLDLGGHGLLDLSGLLGLHLKGLAAWGDPERGSGAWSVPPQAAPLLGALGLAAAPPPPEAPPAGFRGTLRPYQLEGFRWMARLLDQGLGACLADDMGLGKTVQAAALLAHRAERGPALVIAPTSMGPTWRAELARFAPSLNVVCLWEGGRAESLGRAAPGHVLLASYGLLLGEAEALQALSWGTVVLDEAHAIKNPETRRAQVSRGLRAAGRLALTGTPVENRPEELASLMAWLLPGAEGRFVAASPEELALLAAPFLLRRRKAEVLKELPPKTELTVRVPLGEVEAAFQAGLLARCREEALAGGTLHLLAALMKLRRAAAHPALADPAYRGPAAKLDLLLERLGTLREEGHRSLVFSQFTDLLDLVQARLEAEGFRFRRLDGSLGPKARQTEVEAFQKGEAEVFLLSLRAGGTGITLTAADDVFHLDPWWNPAVEDQASDRAHRLGRTRPVTVHRLVAEGTVEERVLALHGAKRALVEQLLEGRDQAAALDRATLEALLG
jgi:superfamily II DNA or RNA helicase